MTHPKLRDLPARPSLEQYKTQAKELARAHGAGDDRAVERVARVLPDFASDPDRTLTLAGAQRVIALEHGSPSWPRFRSRVLAPQEGRPTPGDRVVVKQGPFEGFSGAVVSLVPGKREAHVDLDIHGRRIAVWVEQRYLAMRD